MTPLLVHPLPLGAAAVLLVNDHLLKAAEWPHPWVTGKLSDVAGLFVFPILATALTRRLVSGPWLATAWAIATVIAFAALKLSPGFNRAVEAVWFANALDPTDLLALPAVALSWLYMRRERAPGARDAAAAGFIAIACAATSAPRYSRDYPWWEVTGAAADLGCAKAAAWVSKSGKTGFGLSVRLTAMGGGCKVDVTGASVRLADGTEAPGLPPRSIALEACQTQITYVPFRFDSEAAWNAGVRSGVIELAVASDGVPRAWRMPAEHRLQGFHRNRFDRAAPEPAPPLPCEPVKAIAK